MMVELNVPSPEPVETLSGSGARVFFTLIAVVAVLAVVLGGFFVARRKGFVGLSQEDSAKNLVFITIASDAFFVPVGETGTREQLEYELQGAVNKGMKDSAVRAVESRKAKLTEQIRSIILQHEYVSLANSQKQAMNEIRREIMSLLQNQVPESEAKFHDLAFYKWYLP